MRKRLFIFILSAISFIPVSAQHEIGIKPVFGFLFAHHTVMQYLVQAHAWGAEVYYEKPVSGKKAWHQLYRKPEIGYTFFAGSPGNTNEIGWTAAAVPYIKYHPVQRKHFHFNIKSGMGLGYVSNFFDRIENNKNTAIGSHINMVFLMGFEPEWKVGLWDLGAGVSFIHYSNGAWKVPNLGYNIPFAHISIGRRLRKLSAENETDTKKYEPDYLHWKKWIWQSVLKLGIKEILPAEGPKYGVFCFSFMGVRRHSPMSSFLFSSETYYNQAYKTAVERYYVIKLNTLEAVRTGLAAGYGLNIGRLMLHLQMGYYLYSAYRDFDGSFFHRLGARYVFDNGLILQAGLKTHFAKADNFELGFGYTLGRAR